MISPNSETSSFHRGQSTPNSLSHASSDINIDQKSNNSKPRQFSAPTITDVPNKIGRKTKSLNGETIYKEHPSHAIMLNIKLGIQHSVGKTAARTTRALTLRDFEEKESTFFPSDGTLETPTHKSTDFEFKDYAPLAFRHIRERFQIDPADYMVSISGHGALKELLTPGKSGALFYKTTDDKFLIKTLSKQESIYFRGILSHYYNHVMMNPNTLLPRFFQLFRIKTARGRKIRMVIMHNILPSHLSISERFDIKGSTKGRVTKEELRSKALVTLKDLDFIELGRKIVIGSSKKRQLMAQVLADTTFLKDNKLMDFSLLIGITHLTPEMIIARKEKEVRLNSKNKSLILSPPNSFSLCEFDGAMEGIDENGNPILIYCGIIDILQEYSLKKQIENFVKSSTYDKHTISAVAPEQYSDRFSDFIRSKIFF